MEETAVAVSEETRKENVDKLIRYNAYGSMGIGLIPVPILDMAALSTQQLVMIKKISDEYEIPFRKDLVKSLVGTLMASVLPTSLAGGISSLIKFIPIIGQTIGALTMPIIAGSSTYALGKVFNQHFSAGGTFLDFDPETVKAYFQEKFKEGEGVVSKMGKEEKKK
ncbi:MAG: GTPase [SAR324 cluster bacterium]|uniref:GTPase n=1 Tax=SAR324 cluster bacterium TaxID=2024889 RepID=A0A2A4STL8_9DELT|nr:MAG: GTPase [SAR324 cluster bacterium]